MTLAANPAPDQYIPENFSTTQALLDCKLSIHTAINEAGIPANVLFGPDVVWIQASTAVQEKIRLVLNNAGIKKGFQFQ